MHRGRDAAEQHAQEHREAEIVEERLDEALRHEADQPDRAAQGERSNHGIGMRSPRCAASNNDEAMAKRKSTTPTAPTRIHRSSRMLCDETSSGSFGNGRANCGPLAEPPADERMLLDEIARLRPEPFARVDGLHLPLARERAIEARDEDRRLAGQRGRKHDGEHDEADEPEDDQPADRRRQACSPAPRPAEHHDPEPDQAHARLHE